jgi:peptide/nickel transport system permease protein
MTHEAQSVTPSERRPSLASRLGRALRHTLLHAVPTMIMIVVIDFFLLKLVPGDAADVLAAQSGAATQETMMAMRHQLGLDQSLPMQLLHYFDNLVHLNLGMSPTFGMPVSLLILQRLPNTLLLMATAMLLAMVIGIALGSVMAFCAGRLPDRILSVLSLLFYSVPGFWIGLVMIVLFSVKLGWLPSGGAGTVGADLSGFPALADKLRHLLLPALSLAFTHAAIYARLTRASVIEVKSLDFVRTAAAKGLSTSRICVRHILRNALIPVTTIAGMHIGGLIGGAVVIETVYNWPGLGELSYDAIMGRDYALLLGILLLSSLVVIVTNILVDLLHTVLDPRMGSPR